MTTTFWLTDIAGAKMKIQKKEGRTRVTISDMYSISSTKLNLYGVEQNIKPEYASKWYYNRRKGVFKKLFVKKDSKLINNIIEKSIKKLFQNEEEDDGDW